MGIEIWVISVTFIISITIIYHGEKNLKNGRSVVKKSYYKNGSLRFLSKGEFKNYSLAKGVMTFYRNDGVISMVCEGDFENNYLVKGKQSQYDNGNVSLIADGDFEDLHLVKGVQTIYERGNVFATKEGDFLKGYLRKGKQHSFYEDGSATEFVGDFEDCGLVNGVATHYHENGYVCKVEQGCFENCLLINGRLDEYDENGEFVGSRDVQAFENQNINIKIINNQTVYVNGFDNDYNDSSFIQAIKLFLCHRKELELKYSRSVVDVGYGKFDYSKADKELELFMNHVIDGSVALSFEFRNFVIDIIQTSFRQGINQISDNNSKMLTPEEYEVSVANKLKQYGFITKLTQKTGDQGIDVIATKNNKKVVIQCKLYSNPVGNSAVQEILGGKAFEGADYAVVVSNATFTKSAKQLAISANVLLLHHDELDKVNQLVL